MTGLHLTKRGRMVGEVLAGVGFLAAFFAAMWLIFPVCPA